MYDELVSRLHKRIALTTAGSPLQDDLRKAADAIEELSADCDMYRKGMTDEHNKAARLLWDKEHCWIPVTERLPEEWFPVLGLIQYHDEKESPSQQVLWYLGNGHWRETWRGDMIESDVTHWMPLPEPPKEGT